jgi:transposase
LLNFPRIDGHLRLGHQAQERESRMGRPSKYSEEFRADAVALVLTTGISLAQAGRDLGVNSETLRNWVKQAKIDRGQGPAGALTTVERAVFGRLRRRVVELEQERSILVKAAVFFAKETTR